MWLITNMNFVKIKLQCELALHFCSKELIKKTFWITFVPAWESMVYKFV